VRWRRRAPKLFPRAGLIACCSTRASRPLREVAEVTGFPEMLDGRVKTIHPRVAGGILAMRSKPEHMHAIAEHGIPRIDLVCVNLYEFEKIAARPDATLEELIENIDIRRSDHDPRRREELARCRRCYVARAVCRGDRGSIGRRRRFEATRWKLAKAAFARTAAYDRAVTVRLAEIPPTGEVLPATLDIRAPRKWRYATARIRISRLRCMPLVQSESRARSSFTARNFPYNNLVDPRRRVAIDRRVRSAASAIIKHTNPCGCAEGSTLAESYRRAFEADPVSAFGGRAGVQSRAGCGDGGGSRERRYRGDRRARVFGRSAQILESKKNLRLLRVAAANAEPVIKSISGGFPRTDAGRASVVASRCAGEDEARADRRKSGRRSNSDGRSRNT
jgi:phosphoribosylaminoimidazolecarboxamide formyltransferase/IMP cyclohydrolase